MCIRLGFVPALIATSAVFVSPNAWPNGRATPPLLAQAVVKATCEDRAGQGKREILRTRVVDADKPVEGLALRVGQATEQLAIFRIEKVTLGPESVTRDGFVKATVTRKGDSKPEPVMLRVGSSAKEGVRLAGFTPAGSAISIGLDECKSVEFSSDPPAAAPAKPEAKAKP